MEPRAIRSLLEAFRAGNLNTDQVLEKLRQLPFEDLGFAKVDHHRRIRCGFPEVIYCAGKTVDQVLAIAEARLGGGGNLLGTRASQEVMAAMAQRYPQADCNQAARTVTVRLNEPEPGAGTIAIVAAGTSDLPVAEEARVTVEIMDQTTDAIYDVGIAGLHRLLAHNEQLQSANVLVVAAGMDGALPAVVAGLVDKPVIAVPTSVGYGASFQGIAPLLTMLNSCAAGVAVVNIDNGFGAGYIAAMINRLAQRP